MKVFSDTIALRTSIGHVAKMVFQALYIFLVPKDLLQKQRGLINSTQFISTREENKEAFIEMMLMMTNVRQVN